jgi:hypothetical protein
MTLRSLPLASLLSVLGLAACTGVPEDAGSGEVVGSTKAALIESCFDWNGTCTGLREGSACGSHGTCVADTYGVAGWCTCYETPPPAGPSCPGSGACGGRPQYGSCQRSDNSSGICIPYSAGQSNAPSGCFCL